MAFIASGITTAGVLAAVSTTATVAGAGIAAYGAMSQGQAQAGAAGAQAGIDRQNAKIQREQDRAMSMAELRAAEIAEQQGKLGLQQTRINQENQKLSDLFQQSQMVFSAIQADRDAIILDARARVHEHNAERLFQHGRQIEGLGRDRARRIRMQGDRVQSAMRASIGKSGIVESGSALDVLVDTAGLIELNAQDAIFESRIGSQNAYTESENQKVEGTIAGFNASTARQSAGNIRMGLEMAREGAKLNQYGFELERQSGLLALQGVDYRKQMANYSMQMADVGFSMNMQQSSLNHSAGLAQARASQFAAIGTMASGISGAAYQYGALTQPKR
jgi:hypothetical protein